MNGLDEKKALAIIFANTKRKKRTADLITIANSFEYLTKTYSSPKLLSKKIGLSEEIIREFRKILNLAAEVKDMIKSRKIDRLDVAYRLSKIRDEKIQIEAAYKLSNLPSKDIRDIERIISTMSMSIEDSKRSIIDEKLKALHLFIIDFEESDYENIKKRAKDHNKSPAELIKDVMLNWLNSNNEINVKMDHPIV